jgi:hypothetical protein
MIPLLDRAAKRYREGGLVQLLASSIHFLYENYVRPRLPAKTVKYNGTRIEKAKIGDSIVPWHTTDIPRYEGAIIRSIREHVERGNQVVIVGGGWGVSTVTAARSVGKEGGVVTFEGSESAVRNVEETVHLNDVSERTVIRHAIVSHAYSLRGEKGKAAIVSPEDLPECDVLVLDCEGAEKEILEEMEIRPRVLIVETHGMYGASESEVRERIERLGYNLMDSRVAEDRSRVFCEENGIYVLTAVDSV